MVKIPDDPRFRYVSYHATDLRKTFARERARLKEEAARKLAIECAQKVEEESIELDAQRKVRTIKGVR